MTWRTFLDIMKCIWRNDELVDDMTCFWHHDVFLTSWRTFDVKKNLFTSWQTSWRHMELSDVITNVLHYNELFDVMTCFWRHDWLFDITTCFWRQDKLVDAIIFCTYFLITWHTFWREHELFESWRVFYTMTCVVIILDVMTNRLTFWRQDNFVCHYGFLTSWRTFGRHNVFLIWLTRSCRPRWLITSTPTYKGLYRHFNWDRKASWRDGDNTDSNVAVMETSAFCYVHFILVWCKWFDSWLM